MSSIWSGFFFEVGAAVGACLAGASGLGAAVAAADAVAVGATLALAAGSAGAITGSGVAALALPDAGADTDATGVGSAAGTVAGFRPKAKNAAAAATATIAPPARIFPRPPDADPVVGVTAFDPASAAFVSPMTAPCRAVCGPAVATPAA